MNFDMDLFDKVANSALSKYGWQETDEANLIVLSENATYIIKNKKTGEKDGVLRVSRPGYHTLSELNSEMMWLRQINDFTPLVVANPIAGLDGKNVQQVKGADGKIYFCVAFKFLSGENPDENDEKNLASQFEILGETTACLHLQTKNWAESKNLDRTEWNFENVIGEAAKWGDWRKFPDMTAENQNCLENVVKIIKKRLGNYGKNESNYGLIHADLRLSNLLFENGKIKLIDFDDCGFCWHLFDLACSLSFIETKPFVPELVASWISGYKKVLPFSDADFEEIPTFIMMRRLQLTAWLGSHHQSFPVPELKKGWLDGTMELAERYRKRFI